MQDEANKNRLLSIGEASEYLGVSIDTLRRWEKKERITPLRSPGGHRYYSKDDLDALFGKRYKRDEETIRRTDEELGKTTTPLEIPLKEEFETPSITTVENSQPVATDEIQRIIPIEKTSLITPSETQLSEVQISSTSVQDTISIPQITTSILENTPITEDIKPVGIQPQVEQPEIEVIKPPDVATPSASVLMPLKEESNLLSEEEIERRIGSIIKPVNQKKSGVGDVILAIISSVFFLIDAILLYIWVTSSRIISPIP